MIIKKYGEYISIGISLPSKIIDTLDEKRNDVSRSRYILRILESHIMNKDDNNGFV